MKKRLALVLVLIMMASAATTALASPFADVPADHWAYDSVAELAAAGLIEGYPDGTYGGARMMTRYEAAMVFARALHRLEGQIAANNLLPELDKIKAELMAEIEAKMAAADKPVVETIETKVIEQRIDEQALARIRANEIAIDAMEGDMAYLEARMLGLIDGIRYDMNLLEEQHATGVEAPSMDEIEALIAARIQESLLDVASGVKETTIVERVVSTTPELTRQDVELIAEALIRQQVSEVERTVQENRDLIIGLVEWVDELDSDVRVLKDDVAGLKTSVAKLEKSPVISGDLTMKAEYKTWKDEDGVEQPKGYIPTMSGNLTLNIKASETTDVKAILGYGVTAGTLADKLSNYRVEVTSTTPINSVKVGKLAKANFAPFVNRYVLKSQDYGFAGVAKVNIVDDLTLDLFAGQPEVKATNNMNAGATLQYKFMPEIGLRLSGTLQKPAGAMFTNYAAGIGLFGEVVGVTYAGDFVMDFVGEEDNFLAVVTAKTEIDPVELDVKFIYEGLEFGKNTDLTQQLVLATSKFGVEGGAGVDLDVFGADVNVTGRAYYEGASEADTVLAFKANASATFDLFAPITLSAQYIGNKTGGDGAAFKHHALAKLAIEQDEEYGLRYGASAEYVRNTLVSDANWKKAGDINANKDEVNLNANVGYGLDWSGAKVDLDYAAKFKMPLEPKDPVTEKAGDMTLAHEVTVGYGFTENVELTFGGTVKQTFSEPVANDFGYNAGLTVKF